MDTFGSCDPFVRLTFCGEARQTTVKKGTYAPDWNEAFVYDLSRVEATALTAELLDWDMLAAPEPVGRLAFSEPEMAELADSPAGSRREESSALESLKGGAVVGHNKQARAREDPLTHPHARVQRALHPAGRSIAHRLPLHPADRARTHPHG